MFDLPTQSVEDRSVKDGEAFYCRGVKGYGGRRCVEVRLSNSKKISISFSSTICSRKNDKNCKSKAE